MQVVYGSQYYRPPEPAPEAWEPDLARMRDAGIRVVKVWAMWGWMEPAEGEYRFEELDRLFTLAQHYGLAVLPNLILECAPWWAQDRFPESLWTAADGYRPRLQVRSNTPAGGWPGLCLNNPNVRRAAETFTRAVVDRYADQPALWGWDVWNEPSVEPAREPQWGLTERALFCYCPATVAAYRAWLEHRYGSIERLNTAWGRRYRDWNHVEPPRKPRTGYIDWIMWRRFTAANIADILEWRAQAVKSRDSAHPVISHAGWPTILQRQPELRGADDWQLARCVEVWGMSAYPLGPEQWRDSEFDLALDWTRRASRGRPFWLAEIQAGPHVKGGRAAEPSPEDLERWAWRAVFGGASGILYWQWRSQLRGYESPGYGLCAGDGTPTPRTAAAARVARHLRAVEERLPGRIPSAQAAVLFTYDGYLHDWCRAGDNTLARASLLGAYEALWLRNIPVDPVRVEELEDGTPLTYRVLFLPAQLYLSQRAGNALAAYVENGGWVIAEAGLATWTDEGWASPVVPGCGLDAVFGVHEVRVEPGAWKARVSRPAGVEIVGTGWRAIADVAEDAEILGRFPDGAPALVAHRYGRGNALYFATLVMSRIAEGDPSTADLLADLVAESGVPPRVSTHGDVRVRLLERADRIFLLVWGPPRPSVVLEVAGEDASGRAWHGGSGLSRATTLDGEDVVVERRGDRLMLTVPLSRGIAVVEVV